MSIIKDASGNKSSAKRVMGVAYLVVGLFMALLSLLPKVTVQFDILLIVVGTGTSLLGLGLFEYFSVFKRQIKSENT